LTLTGFCQTNEILDEYRKKYHGHHIVIKNDIYKISIEMVKGNPRVVHHIRTEHLIIDQNGILTMGTETIENNSFETLKINEAYVLVPTEKGSKKIPVTNIATQDAETSGSVFHDDNKETTLIFPRMEIGALRVLDYSIVMSEYKFPFGFHFMSYFPIDNAEFELLMDTCIHPLIKEFNMEDIKFSFTDKTEKGKRKMSWSGSNSTTFKVEKNAPNRRYYFPHLLGQIGYYTTKQGTVNVLNDVNDIHNWYYTNIK
jgi:hypothetical protein